MNGQPARRFQSYRGTWAWLIQRVSAIVLFVLIPVKIYTGWAATNKVPYPAFLRPAQSVHFLSGFSAALDLALVLCFLLHGLYGLRVILIDVGVLREERWFWRTLGAAVAIFAVAVWAVYLRPHR